MNRPLLEKPSKPIKNHSNEHGIGEIFVHQVIETIEFVLGNFY